MMSRSGHAASAQAQVRASSRPAPADGADLWEQAHTGHLKYWIEQLSRLPPLLELPTDRPRPHVLGYAHGSAPINVPTAWLRALREAGARHANGLQVPLLASWMLLLARCGAAPSVITGVPILARGPGKGPVRLPIAGHLERYGTVAELFDALDAAMTQARQHAGIDGGLLQEALRRPHSLSYHPLYQNALDLLPGPAPDRTAPVAEACDLALRLWEEADHIAGALSFATELFDAASAQRLARQWLHVLEAMLADPARGLEQISVLSRTEEEQILHTWNATEASFPVGTIAQFLDAQAQRTPQADAILEGAQRLSYQEFERAAAGVAAALASMAVGPQAVVGLLLAPGSQSLIASYGVLKAGAICLPLQSVPEEHLAEVLADAQPALVITDARNAARVPAAWPQWQPGGPLPERPAGAATEAAGGHADPIAYLIYVSSTDDSARCSAAVATSSPREPSPALRGVALTDASLVNLAFARNRDHDPVGPDDRLLHVPPQASFASQLLLPLLSGACVVLLPPPASGTQFWEQLVGCGVSHLYATPEWLGDVLEAAAQQPDLRLRRVVLHGPAVPRALCRRLRALLPEAALVHVYGMPETAFEAVAQTIDATADPGGELLPLGRPIANQRAYVLDAQRRPVPVGVEGALYIGGGALARGYLNRPDDTAERFVPDPFGSDGARLFATRARACWRADGVLLWRGPRPGGVAPVAARISPAEGAAPTRIRPTAAAMPSAFHLRTHERLATLFNPQGARPPLFCVNGPSADPEAYLQIATLIDPGVPVCGLTARAGEDGGSDIAQRLAAYEREIRARQPRGPYRLCAIRHCGPEAFELARRLERSREAVLLLLIDVSAPAGGARQITWLPRLWQRLRPGAASARRFAGRLVLIESAPGYRGAHERDARAGWRSRVRGSLEVISLPTARELLTQPPAVALLVRHINELLSRQEAAP